MLEKYIGVISCKEDDKKVERLKKFRDSREHHLDLVMNLDLVMKLNALTKETKELKVKNDIQFVVNRLKSLIASKKYATQKFVSQPLVTMRNKIRLIEA